MSELIDVAVLRVRFHGAAYTPDRIGISDGKKVVEGDDIVVELKYIFVDDIVASCAALTRISTNAAIKTTIEIIYVKENIDLDAERQRRYKSARRTEIDND